MFGFSLYHSPPANNLIPLLNIQNIFKKNSRFDEAIESEIVMGYALVASRRYQQASEIFHRSSQYFLKKFEQSKPSDFGSLVFDRQQQVRNSRPKESPLLISLAFLGLRYNLLL